MYDCSISLTMNRPRAKDFGFVLSRHVQQSSTISPCQFNSSTLVYIIIYKQMPHSNNIFFEGHIQKMINALLHISS